MKPLGLPREIRLKRKKWIQSLYVRQNSGVFTITYGSIRILYRLVAREMADSRVPFQAGVTMVRGIRGATVRNRIKRLLREAFRLNAAWWPSATSHTDHILVFMVMYRGATTEAATRIPMDMPHALRKLQKSLQDVIPMKHIGECNLPENE